MPELLIAAAKKGLPNIMLPGGYMPEDGAEPGAEVDALVKMKILPDGSADIISVDGASYMGGEEGEEEEMTEEVEVEEPEGEEMGFEEKLKQAVASGMR